MPPQWPLDRGIASPTPASIKAQSSSFTHAAAPLDTPATIAPSKLMRIEVPTRPPEVASQSTTVPEQPMQSSLRPLTVNEALEYSPFTSILPFDPSVLSLPSADIPYAPPVISDPAQHAEAHKQLQHLNDLIRREGPQSPVAAPLLARLKSMLESSSLSTFDLKKAPNPGSEAAAQSKMAQVDLGLSPMAQYVLQTSDIQYGYPTPRSSVAASAKHAASSSSPRASAASKAKVTSPSTQHRQKHLNGSASKPAATTSSSGTPQIVLPRLTDTSDYQTYDGTAELSKKRKRYETDELAMSDQRAVANAAFQALQDLLAQISEAENAGVNESDAVAEGLLCRVRGADGDLLTLSATAHIKLDPLLQKVNGSGRLKDMPLESLARLEKLCEGAFVAVDSLDITIRPDWSETDASAWSEVVEPLETALRAARTVLRVMTGNREEKQLYGEELLQKIIDLVSRVARQCIVPIVEARSSGSDSTLFEAACEQRTILTRIVSSTGRLLTLLLKLIGSEELAESSVNSIQYFAIEFLFVENAPSEKESVLGLQKFENLRRHAMNLIAEIYARYTEQRQFIIVEVLSSLQKLPTTRQHARQYTVGDGKRLQVTTVLLLKLVSNSGVPASHRQNKRRRLLPDVDNDSSQASSEESEDVESDGEDQETDADGEADSDDAETQTPAKPEIAPRYSGNVKSLYEAAGMTAHQIISFLVKRASTASKTGDTPHRNLLDMFIEDLVAVLPSPEWSASELLLRALVSKMVELAESHSNPAPVKVMALETLGTMGCAILDITMGARQASRGFEADDSVTTRKLVHQWEESSNGYLEKRDLADWEGPFRVVIEDLQRTDDDAASGQSNLIYLLTQWTKFALWGHNAVSSHIESCKGDLMRIESGKRLAKMLYSAKWSSAETFGNVSSSQSRFAYSLILLNIGLCRALPRILNVLTAAVKSDQITVRTRSLKSVTQMVEKEPQLLERMPQVNNLILRCSNDQSSMVRDNALALLGKCIMLRSKLSVDNIRPILLRAADESLGIRKRALKLLKDLYQSAVARNNDSLKSEITATLLLRLDDNEQSVTELAGQILEELWLIPLWSKARGSEISSADRLVLKESITTQSRTLMKRTNDRLEPDKLNRMFSQFLKYTMSSKSKAPETNTEVHRLLVAAAVEALIDGTDAEDVLSPGNILQFLTLFAEVKPKLFTPQQLELFQPYISNLASNDDLIFFRRVVIILKCVLPILPAIQKDFLRKVQEELLRHVQKLARAELNEVAACLWTINKILQNPEKLVNIEMGVLSGLHKMEAIRSVPDDPTADSRPDSRPDIRRTQRLMNLAGAFGHHCDFQPFLDRFKTLSWLPGDFVAGMIVAALKPFTKADKPLLLRTVAMQNIGMVCQAWPQNFNRPENVALFQGIMQNDHRDLQRIVLGCFRDFFASQDQHFGRQILSDEKDPLAHGKLGGSMTATDKDGATAIIAQSFLKDILRISLGSQDDYALTATELMTSIIRQGLVHPKECGPALVAMATSTNAAIADLALAQLAALHLQYESMFEREYMRGINEAYSYQVNIVGDALGYVSAPGYRAKLHSVYETVKTSKAKVQAKFLANYCGKIDFDLARLTTASPVPAHVGFARFLIENLAFFEFGKLDDLLLVISCMEKIFGNTGAGVAHAVNTDIFQLILDPETGLPLNADAGNGDAPMNMDIEDARLRCLTSAAMILTMLWETRTYLRRLYNLNSKDKRKDGRGRPSKDQTKMPPKNNLISPESIVSAISGVAGALESREASFACCKAFAELLAIDHEVKVSADSNSNDGEFDLDDAGVGSRLQTPSMNGDADDGNDLNGDGVSSNPASGSRVPFKRKSSASLAGTPAKKRGRPTGSKNRKSRTPDDEDWD